MAGREEVSGMAAARWVPVAAEGSGEVIVSGGEGAALTNLRTRVGAMQELRR